MDERRFELRWRHHQSTVVAAVASLYRDAALVDVTLACEDQRTYQAHKLVLSACSHYFQSLFTRHHTHHHPIIFLKDVTGDECEALLAFMYRGEVSVGHDQFERIIRVANSLQVRGLAEMETGTNSTSRPSSPNRTSADRSPTSPSPSPTIIPSSKCDTPVTDSPMSPSTPSSQPSNASIHQQLSNDPPPPPPSSHRPPSEPSPPPHRSPISSGSSGGGNSHHTSSTLRSHSSLGGGLGSGGGVGSSSSSSLSSHSHGLSSHHPPHSLAPSHHIPTHPSYPYGSPIAAAAAVAHHTSSSAASSRSSSSSYPDGGGLVPPSSLYGSGPLEDRKRQHPGDHDELKPPSLTSPYPHLQVKRDLMGTSTWEGGGVPPSDLDSTLSSEPSQTVPHQRNPYLSLFSLIGAPQVDPHPPSEHPPHFGLPWNGVLQRLPPRNVPPPRCSDNRTFPMLDPILRGNETRLHKCQYCNRKFKRKDHLKTHVRIHTGERPYKCGICKRGFIQSQQVKIHMKVHQRENSSSLCELGRLSGLRGSAGGGLHGLDNSAAHHSIPPGLFGSPYLDHNSRLNTSHHHSQPDPHTDLDSSITMDSDNECSSEMPNADYDMRQEHSTSSADRTPPPRPSTSIASCRPSSNIPSSISTSNSAITNNSSPLGLRITDSLIPNSNSSSNNTSYGETNAASHLLTNNTSRAGKMTPPSPSSSPVIPASPPPAQSQMNFSDNSPQDRHSSSSSSTSSSKSSIPNSNSGSNNPQSPPLKDSFHLGPTSIKK